MVCHANAACRRRKARKDRSRKQNPITQTNRVCTCSHRLLSLSCMLCYDFHVECSSKHTLLTGCCMCHACVSCCSRLVVCLDSASTRVPFSTRRVTPVLHGRMPRHAHDTHTHTHSSFAAPRPLSTTQSCRLSTRTRTLSARFMPPACSLHDTATPAAYTYSCCGRIAHTHVQGSYSDVGSGARACTGQGQTRGA